MPRYDLIGRRRETRRQIEWLEQIVVQSTVIPLNYLLLLPFVLICFVAEGAVDRHGIHETRGPLMVGGVGFLTPSTGLFRDVTVRRVLSSNQRFEACMQFREQAFKLFATELVSASKYPVCFSRIANSESTPPRLRSHDLLSCGYILSFRCRLIWSHSPIRMERDFETITGLITYCFTMTFM